MTTTHTCREIINTKNLNRILKAKKTDHKTLAKLKKMKRRLKNTNQHEIHFCLSKDGEQAGRLYPKRGAMSLQNLKGDVRKALSYDTYTDVDMLNAHPTILSQLFEREGLTCPHLKRYVAEREACLAETGMSRKDAKTAFIELMYGGKPRENATPFMTDFHTELVSNATAILGLEKYAEFRELGETNKPSNALGSGLGYLAQNIERECVMTMVKSLQTADYEVGTIIHDGFLVKSLEVKDEDLRTAEKAVKLLYGYDIKLEKKPLDDFDEAQLWGDGADGEESKSETEMARDFLEYMEGQGHAFIRFCKEFYWYDPAFGIYQKDLRQLRVCMADCPELPEDKRGMTKFQNNIETQVKALVADDDEFGTKMVDTTYQKIPFSNGVYDVVERKLIDYSREMFFTKKGDLEFEKQEETLLKEVYEKVFLGVFGTKEKADYVLKVIARALAGEVEDKTFIIIPGRTNSGKGGITDALYNCFQTIFGNYNSANLCDKRNDGDTAKLNSWKVALRNARVCVANEKPKQPLQGELLKMASSGGDPQTARQNHQDETTFKLQGSMFLACNDMPKIDGCDEAVVERLRVIRTEYKYLLPDKYEASRDPKTGKVPDFVRPADPRLKKYWLKKEEVQQAFAQLCCEAWEDTRPEAPKCVMEETNLLMEEFSEDGVLQDLIIETGKATDEVKLAQIQVRLREKKVEMSDGNLRNKLKDMGLRYERKQRDGEKIWFVYGIKLVQEVMDSPFALSNDY